MSKELTFIDITTEMTEIAVEAPLTQIDDLTLALIGGGEAVIAL